MKTAKQQCLVTAKSKMTTPSPLTPLPHGADDHGTEDTDLSKQQQSKHNKPLTIDDRLEDGYAMVLGDGKVQNDAPHGADDHSTEDGGPARVDDVPGVLVLYRHRHPQRQQQEEHTDDDWGQPLMLTCHTGLFVCLLVA